MKHLLILQCQAIHSTSPKPQHSVLLKHLPLPLHHLGMALLLSPYIPFVGSDILSIFVLTKSGPQA
jgi:hypothetical protein